MEAERRAEDIAADRQAANMVIESMRGAEENLHRDVTLPKQSPPTPAPASM